MKEPTRTAWLITPFAAELTLTYKFLFAPSDLIIAIDNGLTNCYKHHLLPDLLIGDLDSLDPALLEKLPASCHTIVHPAEKDETDTQLAVEYCLEQQITRINICNDLSGRFDHAMGVVQNLFQARNAGCSATIFTGSQIVFILDTTTCLSYPAGTMLSLISLTESAVFHSSQGLKYSLDNLTLYNWQSKGISNEFIAPEVTIRLAAGTVLAIITA